MDELAAAFEQRVSHFERYNCVRILVMVKICDEKSISEPQETRGLLQPNASDFLQPVVEKSMHAH